MVVNRALVAHNQHAAFFPPRSMKKHVAQFRSYFCTAAGTSTSTAQKNAPTICRLSGPLTSRCLPQQPAHPPAWHATRSTYQVSLKRGYCIPVLHSLGCARRNSAQTFPPHTRCAFPFPSLLLSSVIVVVVMKTNKKGRFFRFRDKGDFSPSRLRRLPIGLGTPSAHPRRRR